MKNIKLLVFCVLAISLAAWRDGEAANGLLLVTREGSILLYRPDQPSSLTILMEPTDLRNYPRDGIDAPAYNPTLGRLFFISGKGGVYSLSASGKQGVYQDVVGIPPGYGPHMFYDTSEKHLIRELLELDDSKSKSDPSIEKHWFLCLDDDGTTHPLDETKPLNSVRYTIRQEWIPGGQGLVAGKNLLSRFPDLESRVAGFAGDDPWRLIGRSDNLTLYLLWKGLKMKVGETPERSPYLIEDRKQNKHEIFVVPKSGAGYVFRDFIVVVESCKKIGWASRGKEDRTGDWYLYYSGAKQIFKTHLDNAFKLQTSDEDKGLLYLTADQVLYELPVSIDGWGQPKRLARLPIEPDWLFVVPEKP